jgi:tetratricopeptide (TPR) repeat protein
MSDAAGAIAPDQGVSTEIAPPAPKGPSLLRKILSAGSGAIHWIAQTLDPLRKVIVNLGVLAAILVGGPAIYRMATKPTFVIKDIAVPGPLTDRGFTGDVVAAQILDRIAEIGQIAGSAKEKAAITGVELESTMPSIQLPVGGFNLNAVVAEIRQLLGVQETKVTGEVYVAVPADDDKKTPGQYGLRLRIVGKGPLLKSDETFSEAAPLIDHAAEKVMRQFDPVNLGYYYYRVGRLHDAYDATQAALLDDTKDDEPWAYSMRGLIAREQGRFSEAIENFRQAVEEDPKFWTGYVNLSDALRLAGRLDEAEAMARKALEINPIAPDGHTALAMVLLDKGQEAAALAEVEKSKQIAPKDFNVHLAVGKFLHKLKRYEDALTSFRTSAQLAAGAEPLLRAADTARVLKREDDAYDLLQQAVRSDPQNSRAWDALGKAAMDRKDFRQATEAFLKATQNAPLTPTGYVLLGEAYARQKRFSEALVVFTKNAQRFHSDPAFFTGWAEALWLTGDKQGAAQKLAQAETFAGSDMDLLATIARSLEGHNELQQAIDVYKRAIEANPKAEPLLSAQIARLTAQMKAHRSDTAPTPVPASDKPADKPAAGDKPAPAPAPAAKTPDKRAAR